MNYGPEPTKEMLESDDEEKLLRQTEEKTSSSNMERRDLNDSGPLVADWRFGPAQIWYDILGVPETGEGFDYGFKIKKREEKVKADIEEIEEDDKAFPDDAFLLVSQLHWEDEIVWNGEDIKHKVIQKLNCKTNAAGWVPSSSNRTAQAFSQPGKGLPTVVPTGIRLPGPIQTPNSISSKINKPQG